MNLRHSPLIIALLFSVVTFNQGYTNEHDGTAIDSLKRELRKAKPGSEEELYIISRIAEKIGKINADTAAFYIERQLELSKRLNNLHADF